MMITCSLYVLCRTAFFERVFRVVRTEWLADETLSRNHKVRLTINPDQIWTLGKVG